MKIMIASDIHGSAYYCGKLMEAYEAEEVEKLPPTKHIFTHLEWHMTGYHVKLKEIPHFIGGVWASREQIQMEYSLPAAFRQYDRYLEL